MYHTVAEEKRQEQFDKVLLECAALMKMIIECRPTGTLEESYPSSTYRGRPIIEARPRLDTLRFEIDHFGEVLEGLQVELRQYAHDLFKETQDKYVEAGTNPCPGPEPYL